MKHTRIPQSNFDFLNSLGRNNNRDWFTAHKDEFLKQQGIIEVVAEELLAELNVHDLIETPSGKKSMHRIYRDTRFSKDKIPYKTNWSGSFRRATKWRRGGYYFHIEPGNSFVGGGFFGPNAEDLRRIREDISFDPEPLRKILQADQFVQNFGSLQGEQLKTTPKGFSADDEAIDLLRYKQFLLIRNFTDKEVLGNDYIKLVNETFIAMRPFFDYMSVVLTSDGDGIEV
jgi:uncharacterized protein (TIGR02453 family)